MLLRLISDGPAGTKIDVANGATATGYTVTNDTLDFGNAAWQHALSGARGTQGAMAVAGAPDNRVVNLPVRIGPSGTVDAFNLKAAQLVEVVDEMRRFGGRILWQATTQTARQYLKVVGGCGITRESWTRKGRVADVGTCIIVAQCAPYMLGDSMDTFDEFAYDSITAGDYTFDVANAGAGALSVVGGLLVPGATGLKRIRHTLKGYTYGDVLAVVKVTTGSTLTNGVWGVTARADVGGVDTLLAAEIVAGTNVVRVRKYLASTPTDLATAAFTPVANTTYWVALLMVGGQATAAVYASRPVSSLTTALASAGAPNLGVSDAPRYSIGHVGLRITAGDVAERYGPFIVEPYTYRGLGGPWQLRLGGAIPGDVPALCDALLSPRDGNPSPTFGLVSWLERPILHNLVWNGDFEDATMGMTGWSAAAVAGVISAGSSVSRGTTAGRVKYGSAHGQIVTPATTDTGATFAIRRRQYGFGSRTFAALVWASSTSQVTSARVKLGVSGDLSTGTAAALSTTPKLYSCVWVPVGANDVYYLAFGVNAATATTIAIDGAVVVESPTVTLNAAIVGVIPTTISVYSTPSDVPNLSESSGTLLAPFLAMIDQEIVRVSAISGTTWTLDGRGLEGTTAATHTSDSPVICLPPLRPHLEGKGAFPAYGVFTADAYVPGVSGAGLTTPAVALTRNGNALRWTPGTSGPQATTAIYLIDPNTLVPDDYTQGDIDVELWLRSQWSLSLTGLRITASAQPEGGATMGPERFTREYGNAGKLLTSTTNGSTLFNRLGVIPMTVDRANPSRWRLKLALACTGGAAPNWDLDYLMLDATRYRLASPTYEQNDASNAAGGYPPIVPYDAAWTTGSMMSRLARADGSSLVGAPGAVTFPNGGFGDVLEVPDGDVDFMFKWSIAVPDDPIPSAINDERAASFHDLHLGLTPRYVFSKS